MNSVSLTGRIASELEVRKTSTNKSILYFPIAVDTATKDEQGNKIAHFFYVQVWERNAEFLAQYAGKGITIGVQGRLFRQDGEYNGERKSRVFVVAEKVEILHRPEAKQETKAVNNYKIDDIPNFGFDEGNPWE